MQQLNIAAMAGCTQALGPGTRAVIWVQGCPLNCRGCIAPGWIPFVPATRMTPEQILERLDLDKISGLTFSGGEPMQQAAGLAALARLARRKKELNLICFTGYLYERLLKSPPNNGVPEFLAEIDVLIDGPFIQSQQDSVGLRGSSNQNVIHLTSRLRDYDFETCTRRVEINVTDGELSFIGIPTSNILSAMKSTAFAMERMD